MKKDLLRKEAHVRTLRFCRGVRRLLFFLLVLLTAPLGGWAAMRRLLQAEGSVRSLSSSFRGRRDTSRSASTHCPSVFPKFNFSEELDRKLRDYGNYCVLKILKNINHVDEFICPRLKRRTGMKCEKFKQNYSWKKTNIEFRVDIAFGQYGVVTRLSTENIKSSVEFFKDCNVINDNYNVDIKTCCAVNPPPRFVSMKYPMFLDSWKAAHTHGKDVLQIGDEMIYPFLTTYAITVRGKQPSLRMNVLFQEWLPETTSVLDYCYETDKWTTLEEALDCGRAFYAVMLIAVGMMDRGIFHGDLNRGNIRVLRKPDKPFSIKLADIKFFDSDTITTWSGVKDEDIPKYENEQLFTSDARSIAGSPLQFASFRHFASLEPAIIWHSGVLGGLMDDIQAIYFSRCAEDQRRAVMEMCLALDTKLRPIKNVLDGLPRCKDATQPDGNFRKEL